MRIWFARLVCRWRGHRPQQATFYAVGESLTRTRCRRCRKLIGRPKAMTCQFPTPRAHT